MNHFGSLLSDFVRRSDDYDRAFLLGRWAEALETLDGIESCSGHSLWLVRARIALLQLAQGLEAQKQYVATIRGTSPGAGVVPFVAYYVSIRNEPTVTASGFVSDFARRLRALALPEDFATYLRYQVAPDLEVTPSDLASILRHECAGAVVDTYETLVFVARVVVAMQIEEALPAVRVAVQGLSKHVDDARLHALLLELGEEPPQPLPVSRALHESLEHYLKGEYGRAAIIAGIGLASSPSDSDLITIASTALAAEACNREDGAASVAGTVDFSRLPHDAPLTSAIRHLASAHAGSPQADESAADIQKLALNHAHRIWSDTLRAAVVEAQSSDPRAAKQTLGRFAAAGLPSLSPLRLRSFTDPAQRQAYLGAYRAAQGAGGPAALAVSHLFGGEIAAALALLDVLSPNERDLALAEAYLDAAQPADALPLAERLAGSSRAVFSRRGIRLLCRCLLSVGHVAPCGRLIAAEFSRNWTLHEILPIREVIPLLDPEVQRALAPALSLAVLYDMHGTFVDDAYDSQLHYAFEDALDAAGVVRPSELETRVHDYDRAQLLYFLEHVCIESVMDRAVTRFASSRDVAEERVAVCRALARLNPEHAASFEREIRVLLSGLLVRRRLREIEESKIYVDREGVVKAADSALRESFNRYVAFLRHGIDTKTMPDGPKSRSRGGTAVEGLVGLPLPENEVRELLRTLFVGVRDEFVSNSAYGLDGFLSTRIRHGTLVNQLRSALEVAHLITPRDEATNQYLRDEYWAGRADGAQPLVLDRLADELSSFARTFDQLVDRIRTDWVQVRRTPGDKGLFDFVPQEEPLAILASLTKGDTPFSEFLGSALLILDDMLDRSLVIVRSKLQTEAKVEVARLLDRLQERLTWVDGRLGEDINQAIAAARTGMQVSFDRVSAWFFRAGPSSYDAFQLEDAISVAEASLQSPGRVVEVNVTLNTPDASPHLKGHLLPHLVDLFFILLDNVVRYDGRPAPHRVHVTISRDAEWITCRVENFVVPESITPEAEAKLERSRAALREMRYLSAVATEGGSGLCKAGKIIAHDFKEQPRITFGFQGATRFVVEFSLQAGLMDDSRVMPEVRP